MSLFKANELPVILQSEAAECGIACLAMVAWHYGQKRSLGEIRRKYSASLTGMTLKSMMDIADGLGLVPRAVRLELGALKHLKLPAILHWNLNHYVVLTSVRKDKVVIHDPAHGARILLLSEAGKSFSGIALELTPTPSFERRDHPEKATLSDLFDHTKGVTPSIARLFALALALELLALLSPLLNQMIVDDVVTRGDKGLLMALVVGLIGLLFINQIITVVSAYINMYMGTQLSFQMQTQLLRHVLKLPVSWFEKRHLGDMLSRFGSLAPAQHFFTKSLSAALLSSVMVLLAIAMMFLYSRMLAAIQILSVLLMFVVRFSYFPWYKEKQARGLHLAARVETTFIETLRGAATFKTFCRERERVSVWQNEMAAQINNEVELTRGSIWGNAGLTILLGVLSIAVWYLGARMIIDGAFTLGMLIAFQAYAHQFTSAASELVEQYFNWKALDIHLERLADIIRSEPELGIDQPKAVERPLSGTLTVKGLSFRYSEHDPWLLKNVSFEVKPGECVCFVGPSGRGKSTLLKLLLGFYEPEEGQILVDGSPLRGFGIRSYRDQIGVVMQDDHLFSGTIADNIAFFEPDFDMDTVEQAAKAAHIHDEIEMLPMGYMSLVGDMGSSLSAGQKQRILIARALYRHPKILFLDEGTANLDLHNEQRVMEVLRQTKITRIFVAHREAAIHGSDRIFLVQDSTVRELPAEELLVTH